MKIAHVLPVNTNENRIKNIKNELIKHLNPGTEIDIITYDNGPDDLEYFYYDHWATNLMIKDKNKLNSYDAISIACFYDPGVRVLRELLDIPVIGISQASVLFAQLYGHKYGILIGRDKSLSKMQDNMKLYGMEDRINWKSLDMTVKELQNNNDSNLLEVAKKLTEETIKEDKSEVIILGCGALSGLEKELANFFQVPVINPIVAGAKLAETLGSLKNSAKLTTSKLFDYENDYLRESDLL